VQRKFFVLPALAALLLLVAFGTGMRCIVAKATHVNDANTFDATANFALGWGDDCPVTPGDDYHVRLIGVQAPTGDECYAQQATDYVKNLVEGQRVCLMRDIGCHDSTGNLLAYVGVNTDPSKLGCDVFLNLDLVRQGYARAVATPPDTLLRWLLELFQCQAYREGRGMWGACPDLPVPLGCRVGPTPPAGSTATPVPPESTPTPVSTTCCRICVTGKACGDTCIPRTRRCDEQTGCACDAQ
jgi:endonuclease YncB( thermonuclease family)